jgi:hypothetical protein
MSHSTEKLAALVLEGVFSGQASPVAPPRRGLGAIIMSI